MRFKTRRFFTTLVVIISLILFISMYLMMNNIDEAMPEIKDDDKLLLLKFKDNIMRLKDQLDANEAKINQLKDLLMKASSQNNFEKAVPRYEKDDMKTKLNKNSTKWLDLPNISCHVSKVPTDSKTEIKMSDVLEKLSFDNPDGGVWKQGYPLSYKESDWTIDEKLLVFVVPHSHDDPGWIKTFEQYYQDQTSHILNNMVDKLFEYPHMRFVYAEMSFFSMWWKSISRSKQDKVKKLLEDNRLEIVTGGWVMTDEANSHYFAMLDQMIEGNQWLKNELGYQPKSGWSIDPFGHSPTMAYLLKRMSFDNMLVQRVHYSIKKEFSLHKQLEYFWRQGWDESGSTDMFCHMMPFYSYDVPHTCGPDPKICCQFDFGRSHRKFTCPWKVQPTIVTDENVKERAYTLLDQYRKKSQLYKNHVLLVPLGDDFRFDSVDEWDAQYNNYMRLFHFMNSKKEWNVHAKFATLSDYFAALRQRVKKSAKSVTMGKTYPTLSGDMFVYADRDEHYWSGYFTSRPFYKKLDRELEYHQRMAEMLLSLALGESRKLGIKEFEHLNLTSHVVSARRDLGLFQHHDGITGTSKDHVVNDYGNKMLNSINLLKQVILSSAQFLLTKVIKIDKFQGRPIFDLDETRQNHFDVPTQNVVDLSLGKREIYFYNPLPQTKITLVTFPVTSAHVEVKDADGNVRVSQVDPIWDDDDSVSISTINFKLSFVVEIPPLGFSLYTVRSVNEGSNKLNHLSKVKVFNSKFKELNLGPFERPPDAGSSDETSLENDDIEIVISKQTGLSQKYVDKKENVEKKMEIVFVKYGTTQSQDKSGAYLFLPDGEAKHLYYERVDLRITEGPLYSEAMTRLPLVVHTIRLSDPRTGISGSALDILNMVDIRSESNTELGMRIITDVSDSDGYFYTDLNGFQVTRRKFYSKLPLQGNFYPMPSMAYLENNFRRFTLLTAQSLGVASLRPGWLEVMQDRRLNQDDNRGVEQGVLDNKRTPNKFRILFEEKPYPNNIDGHVGFFTLKSHYSSLDLLHPTFRLVVSIWDQATSNLATSYSPLSKPLPCDLHLVNLRVMVDKGGENNGAQLIVRSSLENALILHRLAYDCNFNLGPIGIQCPSEQSPIKEMFSSFSVKKLQHKSLNLLKDLSNELEDVPPMELRAYMIKFGAPKIS